MEDSRSWSRQLSGLSDEFTVLAWDAPGCGHCSDVPESWRLPDFADALAEWLTALGVDHPHRLGLSWGSSVLLEFYRMHWDIPVSLIVASAYAGWAGSLPPDEVAARHATILAAADLPREKLLEGVPGVFSTTASPQLVEEAMNIAADNSGKAHPGGYRAIAHSMAEANLRQVLPHIGLPTLSSTEKLISGHRSTLPTTFAGRFRLPSFASFLEWDTWRAEAPDEFNGHVRRFLRRGVHREVDKCSAPG